MLVLIFRDSIQSAQQVIGVDDDESAGPVGELVENLLVVAGARRELRNDGAGLRGGIVQIRVGAIASGPPPPAPSCPPAGLPSASSSTAATSDPATAVPAASSSTTAATTTRTLRWKRTRLSKDRQVKDWLRRICTGIVKCGGNERRGCGASRGRHGTAGRARHIRGHQSPNVDGIDGNV